MAQDKICKGYLNCPSSSLLKQTNRGRLCCFNIIINVSPALLLYLTKKLLSPQTKEAALLLDIVDFLFSFLSFSVFCCSLILSHGYI